MWTYLLGPFVALLPNRWRRILPFYDDVNWGPAATISGLGESVAALIALSRWYSVAMSAWIENGVSSALAGRVGPNVTPQEIGSVALVVWASHPLTWLLTYFGVEGVLRLGAAAFSESTPCTFPLFLVDKLFGAFGRRPANVMNTGDGPSGNLSSIANAVRERALTARLPTVSDELCFRTVQSEEILEIHACRKKDGWTPPRIVRYADNYYRLEAESRGAAPRPFHYTLRRLPVGVPGRSVLQYAPDDAVVAGKN